MRKRISPLEILTAICLAATSWVLFRAYFIHTAAVVFLIILPEIILLFLLWRFVRLSKRTIRISGWQYVLFWGVTLLLTILAPIYVYFAGLRIAENLVKEMNVRAVRTDYQVQMFDEISDTGTERRVFAEYRIENSLESAKENIISRVQDIPEWEMAPKPMGATRVDGSKSALILDCDIYLGAVGGHGYYLWLWEDGLLTMTLYPTAPQYCNLE